MTATNLIPRLRYRAAQVIAIRCTACRTWRKPRHFNRNSNICRTCVYGAARRRVTHRAAQRG